MKSISINALYFGFLSVLASCGSGAEPIGPLIIPPPSPPVGNAILVPGISVGAPSMTSINSSLSVDYAVTFTGAASITLASSDLILNVTGNVQCQKNVSGTGNLSRTVSLSDCSGRGTVGFSIAPNTATNSAGDPFVAFGPSQTVIVENLNRADINRDGNPDLIFRGNSGVGVYAQLMGDTMQPSGLPTPIDTSIGANWVVVGVHDFDNDYRTDILLFHDNSDRNLKFLKLGGPLGTTVISQVYLTQSGSNMELPAGLAIKGVADLDSDKDIDLLLRSASSGQIIAYEMDGLDFKASHVVDESNPINFDLKAAHETLVPQKTDLIFQRNTEEGEQVVFRWRLDKFARIDAESHAVRDRLTESDFQIQPPWRFMAARRFEGEIDPSVIALNTSTKEIRRYMFETTDYCRFVGYETLLFGQGEDWNLASD